MKAVKEFLRKFEEEKDICRAVFNEHLTTEDRQWVEAHIVLAGKEIPPVDISWVSFTT